jgi:16S rRNA (guanine527-N7)-methyltransferase
MSADGGAARLAELSAQHRLTAIQHDQLARLLALLGRDARAPTSVRSPERAVDVHIADSLAALELEPVRAARSIADLGAGAGFPGIVLAAALPACEVALVDSQARRCAFMQAALARLDLANARVVCARAEQWQEGIGENDAVLARALAPQPVVLEYAAPLLRPGGILVDWRGRRRPGEEQQAAAAAQLLGLRREEIRKVPPFAGGDERHLHLYLKVTETPARFPRRAGVARKRPLGGAAKGVRAGRSPS